jgi:hypothetical protein
LVTILCICSGIGVHQLCPQFTPSGPFSCTETSIIVPGRVAGASVVAKHPIDTRPFWQARARHEITAYTVIASVGEPPVPLPRMLLADPALPLIVLTMMPGTPLGPDRYPVGPLPPAHLDWLLPRTATPSLAPCGQPEIICTKS